MSASHQSGKLSGQLTVRMDAALFHDVGVTAFRMEIERSEVVRQATSIFAQVVDDAWYFAQIGAEPTPSIDRLAVVVREAMAAEIAVASRLMMHADDSSALKELAA